jgi:anti-anti-sigma factor
MFDIGYGEEGNVSIKGRLDAAHAPRAQEFLDQITGQCILDMGDLEYISSAGLGVLLRTHKRMMGEGQGLKLVNVNSHINDIFTYSGFNKLFDIEVAG